MNGALLLSLVLVLSQVVSAFKNPVVSRSYRLLMATDTEFDLKT